MKYIHTISFLLLFALFSSPELQAQDQEEYTLELLVEGLSKAEGQIGFQLMDANEKVLESWWVPVTGTEVKSSLTVANSGDYAIRFFHDANSNNEMDMYWFGAPKESYGNSNDIKGNFGPPEFERTIFSVDGDMSITMQIL
jgi:uncharacterized protein (DUF2141 family)